MQRTLREVARRSTLSRAVVCGSRGAVKLPGLHPPVRVTVCAQVSRVGGTVRGAGDFLHVNGRMVDANNVVVLCLTLG